MDTPTASAGTAPSRSLVPAYPSPRWAVGLIAGAWLARHLVWLPPSLAALAVAATMAGPRPTRRWLLPLALGVLAALARPDHTERVEGAIDTARPVVLVARVDGPLHGTPDARRLWLQVELVAQRRPGGRQSEGPQCRPLRFELLLTLPDDPPPDTLDEALLAPGARVRLRGHLGRLRASANPGVARDGPWTLRLESWRFLERTEPPGGVARAASRLRGRLEARLDAQTLETPSRADGAALARALVLGDAAFLPERWRRGLRASGSVHVLAVSGLHVGLVAAGLWLATGLLGRRGRAARFLLCLAGVGLYLLLVGPRPAALRAAVMAAVALTTLLVARPPIALHALSVAVVALVLARPSRVDSLGFQLSVAATLSLLVVAPPLARALRRGPGRRLPRALTAGLAAAMSAQAATAPFLLRMGGGLHPATPALDLLLLPWLTASLALSMVWAAAVLLDSPAPLLLDALTVATRPLEWLAEAPAGAWRRLSVPRLVGGLGGVVGGVVGAVSAVLLATPTGPAPTPAPAPAPAPELIALDVGQGDALLLRDGPRAVLIDGGGWRRGDIAARILLPSLDALGVHRLDAVVLTHPDIDHCDGLDALGPSMPTGAVWASPGWTQACAAAVVSRRGRSWRPLWRGERLRVGRWHLDVLWPPPARRGGDSNDRSLVLRAAVDQGLSVLLAADIEASTEAKLVASARRDDAGVLGAGSLGAGVLRADVLKLAHHGSRTSTSRAFLRAVAPRWALVSAGARNRYGHPHPTVLARLERAGVRVLRVDRSGQVRLRAIERGRLRAAGRGSAPDIVLPASPRRDRR